MKTEFLTPWEMLAIQTAMKIAVDNGSIFNPVSKDAEELLDKLELATHVRLTYRNADHK